MANGRVPWYKNLILRNTGFYAGDVLERRNPPSILTGRATIHLLLVVIHHIGPTTFQHTGIAFRGTRSGQRSTADDFQIECVLLRCIQLTRLTMTPPIALCRMNGLFARSDHGGETAAVLFRIADLETIRKDTLRKPWFFTTSECVSHTHSYLTYMR